MTYRVILPKSVQKELGRLPPDAEKRVEKRLLELESNPRPPDAKKLKGRPAWRTRVGDYRIIYEIQDREVTIIIVSIGHRRGVYR